jgi:hypothetical protein
LTEPRELLLEHASEALGPPEVPADAFVELGERGLELAELLAERNGFYAFGSALHVFPYGKASEGFDVETWNGPELWRQEYGDLAEGHFFFAEDAFGNQFSIDEGRVVLFDAETGRAEGIADDIAGWLERIVADHRYLTGWPVAVEWQEQNEPLPPGKRLMPKQAFVLGGEFEVSNLRATDAVEAMQYRGYVAQRLRDVPDGATVQLHPQRTE